MGYEPSSFLGGLEPSELDILFKAGRRVRRRAGQHLAHEGQPATVVWFLVSGTVKLTKVSRSGREVLLELRGPGEILGDMGAIDRRPRAADIVALGQVEALALTADDFLSLLRSRAPLASRLVEVLVARLRQASMRQLEMATVDVIGRVCVRLCELVASRGVATPEGVLIMGISQRDLAAWVGTSRDSVVRALRELRDAGMAEVGRKRLVVRDVAALRGLASLDTREQ